MPLTTPFNFEEFAVLVRDELKNSATLSYIRDDSIIIVEQSNKDLVQTFTDYMIRLSAPESGFLQKIPKIGKYYTNYYSLAIELWLKSPQSIVAKGVNRLLSGSLIGRQQKGIFEILQDVSGVLEHNTFNGQLDPFPGTNIGDPVALAGTEGESGVSFIYTVRQNNIA